MTKSIDISNIIRVSIAETPALLTSDNVNVLAVFTKETPLYAMNDYVIYKNPSSAANDFGSDSMTYRIVNNIFSQSLNVLAGNGYVVVFPMLSSTTVAATAGYIITNGVIENKWFSVEKGSFGIKVDGAASATNIQDIDFTDCESVDDIVSTLNTALTTASVGATAYNVDEEIKIISSTTGASSKVELVANVQTDNTDLTTLNYFNIDQCTKITGEAQYTGVERLQDAVARCQSLIFFEGILTTYEATDSEISKTAENIQSLNKLFFPVKSDMTSAITLFTTIMNKGFNKTRCLYYGTNTTDNDHLLFASGYASKLLSVNFDGVSTANNLANKAIVGIEADTTIGDTELTLLKAAGIDSYCSMKGLSVIQCSGKNEWSDTQLFKNWIQNAIQTAGFNALRGTATKIAQTESGVQVLVNAYRDVMEQAVRLGYVADGSWNGSIPFGNQELFLKNIEQVGYYIYTLPVKDQTQEQRNNRICPACYIACKLAGAINEADITIFIEN